MKRALAIVVAAGAVGGLAGALIGLALDDGTPASASEPGSTAAAIPAAVSSSNTRSGLTPEQIYRQDAASVVVITDTQSQQVPTTPFSPSGKQEVQALGSGFVIDNRGDILTNDHVVAGATGIRVGFTSGASYAATVVGTDPTSDLAVVRVQAPSSVLHSLAFDDSSALQVGDSVYAIGNPFGLDRTMTGGIVSALGRDIQAPNGLTIPKAVQTDAPINHGNSGGPLLDARGRVIGVNAQIEGGTVDGNVGVGFAIPSNTAKSVADQLIENGRVEHAWLGVEVETIDPALAGAVRGLPAHGVLVARVVPGGPAAQAGLQAGTREVSVDGMTAVVGGDAITTVEGKEVDSSAQLAEAVALRKPGDKLTLTIVRDGSSRTVEVTLGTVPSGQQGA